MRSSSRISLLSLALLAACSQSPAGPPDGPVGMLRVTATTTGPGAKPTLLQLLVDDDPAVIIDANGSHEFEGVTVGDLVARVVVPGHCTADHYAPRTVEIEEGVVTELTWSVRCLHSMAPGMVFHTRDPHTLLWTATSAGTTPERLESHATTRGYGPAVNTTRTRVAYISNEPGDFDWLHIMDADGSHDISLPVGGVIAIDWFPDGSRLLVTRHRPSTAVVIVWADGTLHSTVRELSSTNYGGGARLSPDGTRIAYREGTYAFIMSLATGVRLNLFHPLYGAGGHPSWSPDGTQLAYTDSYSGTLWRIDADGGDATKVLEEPAIMEFVDWATDGRLLYGAWTEPTGLQTLRTVPSLGGAPTVMTTLPARVESARWVP